VNFVDSIRIYKIDNNCNSTEILKWAVTDYGNVTEFLYSNMLFIRVDGGQAGVAGLYSLSPTTSINQVEKSNNQLTIYPNPVNDVLYFNVSKNAKIKIYDLIGNLILEQEHNAGQHAIHLNHLSKGMYFIIDGNGGMQKFVKE
jgi:hypothetical protein